MCACSVKRRKSVRRLILRSFQSPGDIVMLTAAVRDLHTANPGQFETDVRTSADALWENNPYLTRLSEGMAGVESVEMHYPLIHQSNQRPYHFIHGYAQFLEDRLGVRVPVSQFRGDIYLSAAEKTSSPLNGHPIPERFWIMVAGGKHDFTAKWWNPTSYQKVVNHFAGKIKFVQVGEFGHWHTPLDGVINLIGKTTTRQFVRLMHHADGVVCPVTFAMHLAAAVETRPGRPKNRPCVVIAGGREPTQWEAYPHHRYLSLVGALSCCVDGGCWKSRCQLVGDGDVKDRHDLCELPVQITPELRIPKCMDMITPDDVIRQIDTYYQSGALRLSNGNGAIVHESPASAPHLLKPIHPRRRRGLNLQSVLIDFTHGLGDAVQLTCILKHLVKYRPEWTVDVATEIGKHTAYTGQCRRSYVRDRDAIDRSAYSSVFELPWWECYSVYTDSPCTKVCNCLREVFGITPDLELLKYSINVSGESLRKTADYLQSICGGQIQGGRFPVVAIHYEGNTSGEKKNLPHESVSHLCNEIRLLGYTPLILDWDRRSPLPDQKTIFCPGVGSGDLWHETGTGDAERLAALLSQCAQVIGIDSGPLHVAGATETPTLGVWTGHSPIQFFDLCSNVTHLVSAHWQAIPPCQHPEAAEFFKKHYAYRIFDDLERVLVSTSIEFLQRGARQNTVVDSNNQTPPNAERLPSIRAVSDTNPGESFAIERVAPIPISISPFPEENPMNALAATLTWMQIPGLAHEIAVGADGTKWCLGMGDSPSGYSIHRWRDHDWDHIEGAAVRVAAGPDGQAWTINRDHQIRSLTSDGWVLQPGLAREIAIGADGAIWCVSPADIAPGGGSIHVWNGHNWDHVEGAAVKIAVGPDGEPWIINSAGQIFRRFGEGWELLPGLAKEIARGADGSTWCLSPGPMPDGGHSIHQWNGADWDHIPGAAIKISAGPMSDVLIVNSEHVIFHSSFSG